MITATSFTARWLASAGATGYRLDVAEDSAFTTFVAGFEDLDVGNVTEKLVTGLTGDTTYYARVRAYNEVGTSGNSASKTITTTAPLLDLDGNTYSYVRIGSQEWIVENLKVTKYADGSSIPNLVGGGDGDWHLPSKDELVQMINELRVGHGETYGFSDSGYWSSSEFNATEAWYKQDSFAATTIDKSIELCVRACRAFTSLVSYSLRDVGPAGGWIFYKNGNDYLEAAPEDQEMSAWSNVIITAVGTTGTAIGTGAQNTIDIIAQVAHLNSAAKVCDGYGLGWSLDEDGAYCWYDNDIANKTPYGALYNWYAVNNSKGLVYLEKGGVEDPRWRVPTLTDWQTLKAYLGGLFVAGGKLKEIGLVHWIAPNLGATNEYGFTAVPAGERGADGSFDVLGYRVELWTSTPDEAIPDYQSHAAAMYWSNTQLEVGVTTLEHKYGFSVRAVRDV